MKIKRIIIGCLVSVFGIINVNAASLEITGVSTLKTDENGKYEIKLKDVGSDEFTQVEFEVAYDSNLIKFEGNESNDYSTTPNYSGNKAFIVSANNYKDGVIGAFNITNLSGETATTSFVIKNIKFKKGDVEVGTAADYSKTLTLRQGVTTTTTRPKNTSASVTSLSFKNATMKPAFNQSIHEYKLYTKDTIRQVTLFYTTLETGVTLKSECTVGCTVSSQSDTIIQTIQGKNEVIFKFTSEDEKNTEEYKFIIYRGETTDGSNKLAGLNIKDYNINEQFDENTLDYTASVPYEVENLEINATAADENAKVEIPAVMVEKEVDKMVQNLQQRLQYQGLTLEQYFQFTGTDAEKMREYMKENAETKVKTELVLEALQKAEKMEVLDEELKEKASEVAKLYGANDEKMVELLLQNQREALVADVMTSKVINFLKENN